jgi:hypothetical protein
MLSSDRGDGQNGKGSLSTAKTLTVPGMRFLCCSIPILVLSLATLSQAEDTPPEVLQAIADLDSDAFLTREKASETLLAAGAAAIKPLEAATGNSELEAAARAMAVLEQLAVEGNGVAVREAAVAAVTRLAATGKAGIASRATTLLEAIAEIRRSEAVDRLTRLGAKFNTKQMLIGPAFLPAAYAVEIGPEWRGEEDDLKLLALLDELRMVTFSGDKVTDAWLTEVAAVPSVQSLKIKKAKVTSAGIEQLKRLKELYVLELYYFGIDDAVLRPLADMRQLSVVRLYGTKVSKEGGAKLAFDLATTKIDIRRGGFLGIGVEPHPLGCMIMRVEEKSVAAKAGLSEGMVLTSISGERPTSFEDLTRMIGRFEPGQEITLQIYSSGDRETLKLKLGEWE